MQNNAEKGEKGEQLPAVLCAQRGVQTLVALVVWRVVCYYQTRGLSDSLSKGSGESGCSPVSIFAVDADEGVGMGSALVQFRPFPYSVFGIRQKLDFSPSRRCEECSNRPHRDRTSVPAGQFRRHSGSDIRPQRGQVRQHTDETFGHFLAQLRPHKDRTSHGIIPLPSALRETVREQAKQRTRMALTAVAEET
ncbi:hypothetical protein C8F04DRAFT_1178262 [Mycena alexandri]|uniref:Uncharacterized protein n=1 Tax=Mycena alexandri TaxID=1745969 RepID=A0AAD6T856_9AGAR|nr:hypothetical protein C8F04DRAFT_1178262 [Mycena alexandri]